MNILVTGARGFVGKNLVATLLSIKSSKSHIGRNIKIDDLFLYDINSPSELLDERCQKADFIFHLAGVNRSKHCEEYWSGNFEFTAKLLNTLKKYGNTSPVLFSSSVQATLLGRYNNEYGKSKKAAEELMCLYGKETSAKVLIYRLPNLFGKWCRPNYNSVIATFCNNIANDLPIFIDDATIQLELLYIDDLIDEMIAALMGYEHVCENKEDNDILKGGRYCAPCLMYKVRLGEIVELLKVFKSFPATHFIPESPLNSFAKKLHTTYLSYLPKEKVRFPLKTIEDARGSFTELLCTEKCGQFNVNICKPGVVKGQHWHQSKWEIFVVVSGKGIIHMRKLGTNEIVSLEVSGERLEVVQILPGYVHNIVNVSETDDLVVFIWANECFDANKPDTFFEEVEV